MSRQVKEARISTAIHYRQDSVISKSNYLSTTLTSNTLQEFQNQTGLADLFWKTIYHQAPGDLGKDAAAQAVAEAEGYLFFMHGWNGSHRIWEKLPYELAAQNPRVVCFNFDLNGFGRSPFISPTPSSEHSSPAAIMAAVEYWLAASNLWPNPNPQRKPFYLFIGHSMGGAATFYKDITDWQNESYGFYALAPALFSNDAQRQHFFKTIGLSIRIPSFNGIKDALAPRIIDILGTGASSDVKQEHLRIYNKTSFGTIAQALYMLGAASGPPQRSDWSRFRIALGHKDRIVRLNQMLSLLDNLGFRSDQIKVMLGDHYFFSYGQGSPVNHQTNQKIVLDDLLDFCHQLAQESKDLLK